MVLDKEYDFDDLITLNTNDYDKVKIVILNENKYSICDEYIYDILVKFKNLRELIFKNFDFDVVTITDIKDFYCSNDTFNNKISFLKNLSTIEIEFKYSRFVYHDMFPIKENLYYKYSDHMLIIDWNKTDTIPENITHLNIMYISNKHVELINNLPNTIEHLHMSCIDYEFIKNITNLPISLKTINITIIAYDDKLSVDFSDLKIPFGCNFEFDYIVY